MVRPRKVDEFTEMSRGIMGWLAELRYNEIYGEVEDKHLTWFGFWFRGGRKKLDELRMFNRGWRCALGFVARQDRTRRAFSAAPYLTNLTFKHMPKVGYVPFEVFREEAHP